MVYNISARGEAWAHQVIRRLEKLGVLRTHGHNNGGPANHWIAFDPQDEETVKREIAGPRHP